MKSISLYFAIFVMAMGCSSSNIKNASPLPPTSLPPTQVLEQFWQISKANVYPKALAQKFFTQADYNKLHDLAKNSDHLHEFSGHLNDFLKRLGVSHTHFYTDQDLDFYFFRSLFTIRDPNQPAIWHMGAEFQKSDQGYFVRSVLDGLSAQKSGLRRGDLILKADDKPFQPFLSFKNSTAKSEIKLSILRNSKTITLISKPTFVGLQRSYIDAIQKSVKVIFLNNKSIGYVHLWSGTHDETVQELKKSMERLKDTDALILDLRDGYGGAWWDHLGPFFKILINIFKRLGLNVMAKNKNAA